MDCVMPAHAPFLLWEAAGWATKWSSSSYGCGPLVFQDVAWNCNIRCSDAPSGSQHLFRGGTVGFGTPPSQKMTVDPPFLAVSLSAIF